MQTLLRDRRFVLAGTILVLALAATYFGFRFRQGDNQHSDAVPQSGPVRPFGPDSQTDASPRDQTASLFVGTQECTRCHTAQHRSYLLTAHSNAMSIVIPSDEPPDAEFLHPPSGRRYQVERNEQGMWHIESLAPSADQPVGETDRIVVRERVKFLVGSGRHSRTYLIENDGFLAESPITWYASLESWGMSPGYDQAHHAGFERPADEGCLICHSGRSQSAQNTIGRADFLELAIGCERCHGPGVEHVQKWSNHDDRTAGDSTPDDSIVHPGQLSRALQEDICASCHLRGDATVVVSGRSLNDFQPGEPLSRTRIDYHLASSAGDMTVVGHVTQMHASRCYQEDSTFTCTTCHDSHAEQLPADPVTFYRNRCLNCHSEAACGLAVADRRRKDANDNCTSCHMPQVSTDIPHIAFTHHRVGIHPDAADTPSPEIHRELVPFGDVSELSAAEQQRCLALAYSECSYKQSDPDTAEIFRERAIRLLSDAVASGLRDGEVLSTLAQFAWEDRRNPAAQTYAEQARWQAGLAAAAESKCRSVLGDIRLEAGDAGTAADHFRKLTQMRRNSEDWRLLGLAEFRSGHRKTALDSLRHAIEIQPFRPELHGTIAEIYHLAGDTTQARRHLRLAQLLSGKQ